MLRVTFVLRSTEIQLQFLDLSPLILFFLAALASGGTLDLRQAAAKDVP